MTNTNYENDIAELLAELSEVQTDLIALLGEKRECLASGDTDGLATAQSRADSLVARLESCQTRRQALLAQADSEGISADSLQSLAGKLGTQEGGKLGLSIADSRYRTRLLQHQSLTNWVIVQRSLLHLTQMIEIFATGGKKKPTYGNGHADQRRGNLVDRAV